MCDVGCGAGAMYNLLKEKYKGLNPLKYTGLDISENSVNVARSLFPETNFEVFDATIHPLTSKYDVVFSSEMLSHIQLRYQKEVVKKLIWHSRKLCLFSLKYSDMGGYEYMYKDLVYYIYPNYEEMCSFIISVVEKGKEIYFHKKKGRWDFLKDTKYYDCVGNLIVEIRL